MERSLHRGSVHILQQSRCFALEGRNIINDEIYKLDRVRRVTAGEIGNPFAFQTPGLLARRKDLGWPQR